MSDGPRSGRSTGRVSCKSTELKRCSIIEMRWNRLSMIMIIIIFFVSNAIVLLQHQLLLLKL